MESSDPIIKKRKAAIWVFLYLCIGVGTFLIFVWLVSSKVHTRTKYFQPGIEHYNRGEYAVAMKDLQAGLKEYPGDSNAHYYLGLCLLQENQKLKARQQFMDAYLDEDDSKHRNREFMRKCQALIAQIDKSQ